MGKWGWDGELGWGDTRVDGTGENLPLALEQDTHHRGVNPGGGGGCSLQ